MHPNMAPDPWNLRMRVIKASRYLSGLSDQEVADVIRKRLSKKQDPGLPRFERFENPADIFIDVARRAPEGYERLRSTIQRAVATLLTTFASTETMDDPEGIGEVVFLAGRVDSEAAINPLAAICLHRDADRQLVNNEPLRLRAFRALFGLLITFPKQRTEVFRQVFERYKFDQSCVQVCVPALIALFGEDRALLMEQARNHGALLSENQVNLQLLAAGTLHI
jgi:hypothetical protein